jgi:hypothetical protein
MRRSSSETQIAQAHTGAVSGFWRKALGVVLLAGSVGLVSCQALFSL